MAATIVDLIRDRAETKASADACRIRSAKGQWTGLPWSDRLQRAQAVAHFLGRHSIEKGSRVVLLGNSNADWQLIQWSILFAGGVVVGIDPTTPHDTMREMLESVSPMALIALTESDAAQVHDLVPSSCRLQAIAADTATRFPGWSNIPTQVTSPDCLPVVEPSDAATIIFTSGTSGTPKAITYTHAQVMVACEAIAQEMPIVENGDHVLSWLPLSHLFQRMMNLVAIKCGAIVHFVDDPKLIVECAREVEPKLFVGVPRFYEKLVEAIRVRSSSRAPWIRRTVEGILEGDSGSHSLLAKGQEYVVRRQLHRTLGSKLRYLISGSAPLSPGISSQLQNVGWEILEAYGVSENTVPVALNRPGESRIGSVGKPFDINQVQIKADGEILVRGPGVYAGYLGEDDAPLDSEGFCSTGDLGYFDDEGYLYLNGRKSQMIKTSTGRKIFPEKVEAIYQQNSLLESVVVFGDGRKCLVALVLPNLRELQHRLPGSGINDFSDFRASSEVFHTLSQAISEQGELLPAHEQIARFAVVERPFSIERGEITANLKIRRQAIAEQYCDTLEELYQLASAPRLTFGEVATK